jgi:hypothetical protein
LSYLPTNDISTMPPCKSTLGYIDLVLSDSDEEHFSQSPSHGDVGCIMISLVMIRRGSMLQWRRR